MISKTNIFNFGSPDFIMAMIRKMRPLIVMAGDCIIRAGEIAEEMYFIQKGEVEVLATDNQTLIAVLKEGSFFGEIGLILTGKRTVYVRALTLCILQVMNKNDFEDLMSIYPNEYLFFKKVARQRVKICKPSDVNNTVNLNIVRNNFVRRMKLN